MENAPANNGHGLVVVTGGSGYIAGYCIARLIQDGWRVRTTIRSLARVGDVQKTIGKIVPECRAIEVVAADLDDDAGWTEAFAGAEYVLHVASPVPRVNPKDDDVVVRPARDGTLRVLKAARNAGVKRVVLTSSTAAVTGGHGGREQPFTEGDWTDVTNRADTTPYERAKTIAERAAWMWHDAEGEGLELVVINPSYVLGPVLSTTFSTSILIVKKMIDGSLPGVPRLGFSLVDVRDLARLHVLAMTRPAAAGQRFIGSGDFLWMKDIAEILNAGLEGRLKVPTRQIPDFLVKAAALFDPVIRSRLYDLGQTRRASSAKAQDVLRWKTRPAFITILDTAESLYSYRIV